MEQAVSYRGFVNVSRLGVGNVKCLIRRMAICFCDEVVVEGNNICHQVHLKLLDIFSFSLATGKLSPRFKEIFQRNDRIVGMDKLDFGHELVSPPPKAFTCDRKSQRFL